MLHLHAIRYSRMGESIVKHIDLQLSAGETVCLYGPSGCGKTTILRLIAGLERPDSGSLHNSFARTRYLFQEHRLLPWRTLWENVLLTAEQPEAEATACRARTLLQQLHLSPDDWHKYPDELSGGMRQRTALARALLDQPGLLLLDEAFSALDYELKRTLYRLIQQRVADGMAVVMVSHDRFETLNLAHRIYLLEPKPTHCRRIISIAEPPHSRNETLFQHYLQQNFWQPYHE